MMHKVSRFIFLQVVAMVAFGSCKQEDHELQGTLDMHVHAEVS